MSNTIKLGNLNISSFKVGSADCAIYLGTVKVYPQDSPTAVKFSCTYIGGATYSAACDGSSELTMSETQPSGYEWSDMTSAVIGDCVTTIGFAAFRGYNNLTGVTIGSGVTTIGLLAFGNTDITEIDIPDNVTTISDGAFMSCSALTAVNIGSGVTSIGGQAFQNCSGLTGITVEAVDPPTLGSQALDNTNSAPIFVPCNSLEAYKTAWSTYASRITCDQPTPTYDGKLRLTYYGGSTYEVPADGNTTLTQAEVTGGTMDKLYIVSAEIGSAVTTVGDYVFSGCSNLSSVTISDNVTSIGWGAFYSCSGLTSVDIPSGVTSIGNYAFQSCSSLTSINIPSGVTSIGSITFYRCSSLTSINIPSGVTSIGTQAFLGCSGLTSITIPDSVTSIGWAAFEQCTGLTSCTIGSGVTSIGTNAFYNCSSLTSITCNPINPPTLGGDNVFDSTNSAPIFVPFISLSTYKAANYWNEYSSRLVEIPT